MRCIIMSFPYDTENSHSSNGDDGITSTSTILHWCMCKTYCMALFHVPHTYIRRFQTTSVGNITKFFPARKLPECQLYAYSISYTLGYRCVVNRLPSHPDLNPTRRVPNARNTRSMHQLGPRPIVILHVCVAICGCCRVWCPICRDGLRRTFGGGRGTIDASYVNRTQFLTHIFITVTKNTLIKSLLCDRDCTMYSMPRNTSLVISDYSFSGHTSSVHGYHNHGYS